MQPPAETCLRCFWIFRKMWKLIRQSAPNVHYYVLHHWLFVRSFSSSSRPRHNRFRYYLLCSIKSLTLPQFKGLNLKLSTRNPWKFHQFSDIFLSLFCFFLKTNFLLSRTTLKTPTPTTMTVVHRWSITTRWGNSREWRETTTESGGGSWGQCRSNSGIHLNSGCKFCELPRSVADETSAFKGAFLDKATKVSFS